MRRRALDRCGALLPRVAHRRLSSLAHAEFQHDGALIRVKWADGSTNDYHNAWLQDHCPHYIHPTSGQRTLELRTLQEHVAPHAVAVGESGRSLEIGWPSSPHSHSTFAAEWLWDNRYDCSNAQSAVLASAARHPAVRPWTPKHFEDAPPVRTPWALLRESTDAAEVHLLACLRTLRRDGFCIVTGVTPTVEVVSHLAALFGRIQPTFYADGVWDTAPREESEVVDTAYSNIALPLHTDGSYLQQSPGVQLFVCAEQAMASHADPLAGNTRLADGFQAAQQLRRAHGETFDYFCRVALPFQHIEGDVDMRYSGPIFELFPSGGEVARVRYNETDRGPLAALGFADTRDFYSHARVLHAVLDAIEMPLRLSEGDALLIDNLRVLHGRHGFIGRRNLLGTYLTADDWQGRLRLLERRHGAAHQPPVAA